MLEEPKIFGPKTEGDMEFNHYFVFGIFCFGIFLFVSSGPLFSKTPDYKIPDCPVEKRVKDLLSRMTIEEKVAQTRFFKSALTGAEDEKDFFSDENKKLLVNGIGTLRYNNKYPPREFAGFCNKAQEYLLKKTRLGIPALFSGEALHGYMAPEATVFLQAIALAGAWDAELIESVYQAAALEMRCSGVVQAYAPVLGLARDPRWGRTEETFGEDPYLVSQMGKAAIFGLQGKNERIDKQHVVATAKHFAVHSQPQDGSNCAPGNYSVRVIRENFFYPFKVAIREAGALSVMAAYNEIDGVPAHADHRLLTGVLRNEWGFTGYVTADADAVYRLHLLHKVAENEKQAAALAIQAGVDLELPIDRQCFPYLTDLVKNKVVAESVLDSACARVLRTKFLLGLFDDPYVDIEKSARVTNSPSHKDLAQRAAEKAIILLKNDNNTLPYESSLIKNFAVIGPNAKDVHFGGYSIEPRQGTSVLGGIQKYAGEKFNVRYAEGCKITTEMASWANDGNAVLNDPANDEKLIRKAVETARKCDAVLLVLGGNESTCREAWAESHLGDRADLELPGRQNDLVKAVLATGKPVTVLLINGRPLTINYIAEHVPAILEGWYLGQETGDAVANVIFGQTNPGGKLPITFPRSVGQLPVYYNHKPSAHDRSYLFTPKTPLYPFGHGLSYSRIEYKDLAVNPAVIKPDGKADVTVSLTNTSKIEGDEVVQLYIRDRFSSVTRPVKELKDFKRIRLQPGETKKVQFTIIPDKLAFYDIHMQSIVEPGDFDIMVGTSSVEYLTAELKVSKD